MLKTSAAVSVTNELGIRIFKNNSCIFLANIRKFSEGGNVCPRGLTITQSDVTSSGQYFCFVF